MEAVLNTTHTVKTIKKQTSNLQYTNILCIHCVRLCNPFISPWCCITYLEDYLVAYINSYRLVHLYVYLDSDDDKPNNSGNLVYRKICNSHGISTYRYSLGKMVTDQNISIRLNTQCGIVQVLFPNFMRKKLTAHAAITTFDIDFFN